MINERIKSVRLNSRLTQIEFATDLGVKRGLISNIERGKVKPSKKLIATICEIFGIGEPWLVEGKGKMQIGLSLADKETFDEIFDEMTYNEYRSKIDSLIDFFFLTHDRLMKIKIDSKKKGFRLNKNHEGCVLLISDIEKIESAYKALMVTIINIINQDDTLVNLKQVTDISSTKLKDYEDFFDDFYHHDDEIYNDYFEAVDGKKK